MTSDADPQSTPTEPTPEPTAPPVPSPIALPSALADDARMRDLIYHSLISGLCVVIPIPFLDDWAIERVRRRAISRQFGEYGVELDAALRPILLHGLEGPPGCWRGCLVMPLTVIVKLVLWPIRSVVGMVLFVFTLRRMVNQSTQQFEEAAALACILADTTILTDFGAAPRETADLVYRSVRRACEATDTRVLRGIFAKSLGGGRQALRAASAAIRGRVRRLWRSRRSTDTEAPDVGATLAEDVPGFSGLIQGLAEALRVHPEYLADLHAASIAALAAERAAPPTAASAA